MSLTRGCIAKMLNHYGHTTYEATVQILDIKAVSDNSNISTTELDQLERHGVRQSEINFRDTVFFNGVSSNRIYSNTILYQH